MENHRNRGTLELFHELRYKDTSEIGLHRFCKKNLIFHVLCYKDTTEIGLYRFCKIKIFLTYVCYAITQNQIPDKVSQLFKLFMSEFFNYLIITSHKLHNCILNELL